ncbi:MAG: serpin family protein [Acidimicrobiia bacterium]|nr:serpin family protein [Acidimicrobiia bacterium]
MKTRFIFLLAALALIAAACGDTASTATAPDPSSGPTTPPVTNPTSVPFVPGELIALEIPRSSGSVTPDDVASVVAGDAALGLALLGELADDDNFMISPYSIATALSMLHPGARGTTADEIAEVLNLGVDPATLYETRSYIDNALAAEAKMPPDDERAPFTIRPANSAWGQGGFPFNDDYLEVLARNFGAGMRVVDFIGDAEGSTDTINTWVEDMTEDRIKDLIPPGVVNVDTRLVLVNAIWFKANWFEPFAPEATAPGDFTLLDGSTVAVPLMHSASRGQYVATESYEAVRMPYAGDAAMVIMLPPEGTTPLELAASLTPDDMRPEFGVYQLQLAIPKFEFESDAPLKPALQALGMVEAFSDSADLSGITDAADLFVQDALHKSFIALDENGTEAAAATALVVGLTSAPPPAEFTADRPFLFWIEHSATGEMLFLGQVTNPS